jgi:hypothetical protein
VTKQTTPSSLPTALDHLIARSVERAGGWIGFDRFMALALYAPGLGYYANTSAKFGTCLRRAATLSPRPN